MKRKIIRQGHNTLTITLPSKWAKLFNLHAGDEIELTNRDNGLFLSTEKHDEELKTEINISGMDVPTIWKYFMSAYREGYDEVKVTFNPEDTFDRPFKFFTFHILDMKYGRKPPKYSPYEVVRQITSRFIGFEIVEHHKNYCLIKNMAELSSREFDSSLRRVFLLIQQMAEEISNALKNNDPHSIEHTQDIDINLDKFHDYCIRVLNKTGFKEVRKAHLIFSTLYLLELLGDEFKNLAFNIYEDMKDQDLKPLAELAEMVCQQINQFYDLFYKFDKSKTVAFSQKDMEISFYRRKEEIKAKRKIWTREELEILNRLKKVCRYLDALLELRIEMEF